eukprot:TRINITY_DN11453_c0_g1_i5.p1 TRINITY_DN11453_c0_g1~~TRINITY_DN11453_c0_g1_i5.p1  ORF type:complete len:118 (+),score=23.11 TRINITY_DN11453_c0_g1_i5:116-469(+)
MCIRDRSTGGRPVHNMSGCLHGGNDPKCTKCDGKCTISVTVCTTQLEWLEAMVVHHSLPDSGKAVRCCINWVAQAEETPSDPASGDQVGQVLMDVAVAPNQLEWLQQQAAAGGRGGG